MSAPPTAPSKSSFPPLTKASPTPPRHTPLSEQYRVLGDALTRWLLSGAAGLLLLPLLWWWLPSTPHQVPTATRGYRWLQAGTVQDGDTTWMWALADSAGQAQLLLSRTRGRTWMVRRLGVPARQARTLALGWGSPWRGVLLGPGGTLRLLPDALRQPQQGTNLKTPAVAAVALAIDTQGQQLVLADSVSGIWQTGDAGRSWHQAQSGLKALAALPPALHVLFDPAKQRFFAITDTYTQIQSLQAQQTDASAAKLVYSYLWHQKAKGGQQWERTHLATFSEPNTPALYAGPAASGRLLLIYQDGSATQLSSATQVTDPVLGRYRLFAGLPQLPVSLALASWAGDSLTDGTATGSQALILPNDSALVFEASAEGGRIRRLRLGLQATPASQPAPLPAADASTNTTSSTYAEPSEKL